MAILTQLVYLKYRAGITAAPEPPVLSPRYRIQVDARDTFRARLNADTTHRVKVNADTIHRIRVDA